MLTDYLYIAVRISKFKEQHVDKNTANGNCACGNPTIWIYIGIKIQEAVLKKQDDLKMIALT